MTRKFRTVAGYKINLQKVSSLPIYNIQKKNQSSYVQMPNTEKEIRKTIPFPRASKYLGISLVKENLDPYNENFKTLKKKEKKIPEDGKAFHTHRLFGLILSNSYKKQSTDSMKRAAKFQCNSL